MGNFDFTKRKGWFRLSLVAVVLWFLFCSIGGAGTDSDDSNAGAIFIFGLLNSVPWILKAFKMGNFDFTKRKGWFRLSLVAVVLWILFCVMRVYGGARIDSDEFYVGSIFILVLLNSVPRILKAFKKNN
jgi:hypothetical protein